ncbi:hypothetical protein, partial [Gynuella sp.]|uniref:hypothetical protein n=1 Tax=Gynuella sp. TaxID=2969146 RepID=UPI003D0C759E
DKAGFCSATTLLLLMVVYSCWLLILPDQSTGYAAIFFCHTPEMIISLFLISLANSMQNSVKPNFRKAFNGLPLIGPKFMGLSPFDATLFVLCNQENLTVRMNTILHPLSQIENLSLNN